MADTKISDLPSVVSLSGSELIPVVKLGSTQKATPDQIRTFLGVYGSNTGDQDLSGLALKTTTVNGHPLSANVTVTNADVGLGNAENTSDANKPISIATAVALTGKQSASDLANAADPAKGAALVGYLQTGTGAVGRTVKAKLSEGVSVKDFGAVGDGVTDDTAALQAAITYVESIYYAIVCGGMPSLSIPSGVYLTGSLTTSRCIKIRGDGVKSTFLVLKPSVATSMFICNAENVSGTSIDDSNQSHFSDMTLYGNRVDSVTTGVSHGIECPDTAWSMATQYSASVICSNMQITGFTGFGLKLGVNRNWALLNNVVIRYNNDSGMATYSYDNRVIDCDFGVCKNYGVKVFAGGSNSFVGCNFYVNTINLVIASSANGPSWFTNCAFDAASQNAVSITGPASINYHGFINCRFSGNSTAGAGLYSDILVSGLTRLQVSSSQFIYSTQQVKYLVESSTTGQIVWSGNTYEIAGGATVVPYATAVTNNYAILASSGTPGAYFSSVGPNTLSAMVGATEMQRWDASFVRTYAPARSESANPRQWYVNTSAAANEGRWLWNYSTTTMQFLTSNDAEGGFGTVFTATRSGTTVTNVTFSPTTFAIGGVMTVAGVSSVGGAAASGSSAMVFPAGSTTISPYRVPHGSAPAAPINGDFWTTTEGAFIRINGVTKTFTLT